MKRVARVLIKIIPLILLISLSLTSCGTTYCSPSPSYEYVWGDWLSCMRPKHNGPYTLPTDSYIIYAGSEKETFPSIKRVTFDLVYGLKKYKSAENEEFKSGSAAGIYLNKCIDSTNEIISGSFENSQDYSNIDSLTLIKAFDYNEPLPEEYYFKLESSNNGRMLQPICNHKETITVPEEYFGYERGSFEIILVFYKQLKGPEIGRRYYRASFYRKMIFDYEILPDKMIELSYRDSFEVIDLNTKN